MQSVISKEYKYYFGKKFFKPTREIYWRATNNAAIYAHRWVWMNYYGDIPKGMHIHHIDENPSNNDIRNLQMLSHSYHLKYHHRKKLIDPRQLMLPI